MEWKYNTIKDPEYGWNPKYILTDGTDEDFCCSKMEQLFMDGIKWNGDNMYGGTPSLVIGFQGWDEPDYADIDYCPWCGEKMEYVEVKRFMIERKKEKVVKEVCETVKKELKEIK